MIRINRDFIVLAQHHSDEILTHYPIVNKLRSLQGLKANEKSFCNYLISNMSLIIKADVNTLCNKIIPEVDKRLGKGYFSTKDPVDRRRKLNRDFLDKIKQVFDYKAFSKTQENRYCAYDLVEKLKIKVCPYCNRQYVNTLKPEDVKGGTRATLDHFFLKSDYPYLALSFWNLVPSCYSCNSQLRGQREIGLHPYIIGFEKLLKFRTGINSISEFIEDGRKDFELFLEDSNISKPLQYLIDKARKNEKVFRIDEQYQNHKEQVRELIQNAIVYDKSHSESLFKQFPKLFDDEGDARKMVLGNYTDEKDFEKRPLSKLTKDIAEELGLVF